MKPSEYLAAREADRQLMAEQKNELLLRLVQTPGDPETLEQLEITQREIEKITFAIRSHEQALDAEAKADKAAARAAAEQARRDAAVQLEKLGQEETKLAKKLHKAASDTAEALRTLDDLHAAMMRTAHAAGVAAAGTQYLRLTGYDHALGAIFEAVGVRDALTLPAPSAVFVNQSCEEVAADIADRMRVAAQSAEEKTSGR